MYLSRNKYVIILFHILTQNHALANVDHLKHDRAVLAKVFTSFLKVPWMNVNSSWIDKVRRDCGHDIRTLFENADAGEMWALQMLDAASKIPSGLLTGNIYDLGTYDQCIRVKRHENPANIQGQHCMVSLSLPTKFFGNTSKLLAIQKLSLYNPSAGVDVSLTPSVCLPSSCSVEDVEGFVSASIQDTSELADLEIKVARVLCSNPEFASHFSLGSILVISFFAAVAVLLFICTACDFTVRYGFNNTSRTLQTASEFSLYTNAVKLLNTELAPGTLTAIHGIRVFSMCSYVLGHRIFTLWMEPTVNLSDTYEEQRAWHPLIILLPYGVDTFIVLSGFLVSYWFLTRLRSGEKIDILQIYLHRYLRLTPCLAAMILFCSFILPHLGSGPMWQFVVDIIDSSCRSNWWTNLLHIQNFVNQFDMCIPHSWYLAAEMHFFCLCPIVLYLLARRPNLGLLILNILLIAGLVIPAVQVAPNQYTATLFNFNKTHAGMRDQMVNFYMVSYNRAMPYLIGIFLGYDVVHKKRRISKMQTAFNWTLTCVFLLSCVWGTRFIHPKAPVYDAFWEIIYVTVVRLGWSISMAWIIYACTQGYGGPVGRLLSHPVFVPLSRITYSIYLVHFVIQVRNIATGRVAAFLTPMRLINLFWSDLANSIIAAFILTLFFESPVIALQKVLLAKQASKDMKTL